MLGPFDVFFQNPSTWPSWAPYRDPRPASSGGGGAGGGDHVPFCFLPLSPGQIGISVNYRN